MPSASGHLIDSHRAWMDNGRMNGYGTKFLKSLSVEKLTGLRHRVDAILSAKVADERRSLESSLAKLTRFEAGGSRGKSAFGRGARGKVAPKYRNPENPSETWAGRGLKPRWLSAAIKSGKKLEDFNIGGAEKAAATKSRKVARRK
jgi:DNA-binding protein H-NS